MNIGDGGPEYRSPREWLPEAKTVISFFVPFSEEVRKSNRAKVDEPYEEGLNQRCSAKWLHARAEDLEVIKKCQHKINYQENLEKM